MKLLLFYWLAVSFTTFCLFGIDKYKARRGQWRVSEKMLFLPAVLGGALGGMLGMATFRHKTKHWYFVWGMPLLALAQTALALWLTARL